MRLLKCGDLGEIRPTLDLIDRTEPYAILSHTWGQYEQEVTFADLQDGSGENKAGFAKIQFCADQANRDGLEYFWVDTCCIDKSNNTELSEAINSMYRWYQQAEVCYVYLADVALRSHDDAKEAGDPVMVRSWKPAFRRSRWFSRGWTLQELIAPSQVIFFSKEGERLGTKHTLEDLIHEITSIPVDALRGRPLSQFSVAERMRWIKDRATTKREDQAYSLLGIFNVFMPLIYGEGMNAFARLIHHINREFRDATSRRIEAEVTARVDGRGSASPHLSIVHNLGYQTANAVPSSTAGSWLLARRNTLLTSLGFEQMTSRQSTIKIAYSTTCEWFLRHNSYLEWTDPQQLPQHHGFLWINGKPGAGKSTLMKFAHAHAERSRSDDKITISFFFNARGDTLEKSTIGMYRVLLLELLRKVPELQDVLDDVHPFSDYKGQLTKWTIESLCALFSASVARLGDRRLECFIDALDECDQEQIRDMVDFFEQVGLDALRMGSQLYICFASRHYPSIDIRHGLKLILENEQGHSEDLSKYVQSHLRAGKGKYIEELRAEILSKANSVFLWAVLVIKILNEEYLRGRIFAVKKRLREIPAELSDLLRDILRRDSANMSDLLLSLQWILFAKRPLRREEFYFAMVAGLDPEADSMTEWNPEHIDVDDMTRFVLNSSKGLAELTKSKSPTVQFIHESVRDFLIKDNGFRELWPNLTGDFCSLSHDQLKLCCQTYLSVDFSTYIPPSSALPKASSDPGKELRQKIALRFPFLEYASQNVLYHADKAAHAISQDEFLRRFALNNWIRTNNLCEQRDIRRYTPKASLLYILSEHDCAKLISIIIRHGPKMGVRGERYQYPIFAAMANGHRNAVRALLQHMGTDAEIEDVIANLNFGRDVPLEKVDSLFPWALRNGYEKLAELLVVSSNLDIPDDRKKLEAQDRAGTSPLHLAAGSGWKSVVASLLYQGVNTETKDENGMTPLHRAAMTDNEEVVEILLNGHSDIEARQNDGKSALQVAAYNGKSNIVRLLMDRDADIQAQDSHNRTALVLAAESGHENVVYLLLRRVADMEKNDTGKALRSAVERGEERIVRLLHDAGADLESRDGFGRTALSVAATNGRNEIVELLLEKNADIEARGSTGRTPLSYATECGSLQVVHLLISRNVNVATEDNDGRTPLTWLMSTLRPFPRYALRPTPLESSPNTDSHKSLMKSFCSELNYQSPARISTSKGSHESRSGAVSKQQNSALQDYQMQLMLLEQQNKRRLMIISNQKHEDAGIVRMLLAKYDEHDKIVNANRALLWAAGAGNDEIVNYLLDIGVDIDFMDASGRTAFPFGQEVYDGMSQTFTTTLEQRCKIYNSDISSYTALWCALVGKQASTVRLLVRRGANTNAQNKFGDPAWKWAANSKEQGLVDAMKEVSPPLSVP